jgi:protein TonB
VIGTNGGLIGLQPMNQLANPDLAAAAMEAVRQWQYSPTLLNGVPVEVQTTITVNFKLE